MATKVKAKAKVKKEVRRGRTSTSRLSTKNQVTVPVDILREAGLMVGDVVNFEVKAGAIIIKVIDEVAHPLAGLLGAGRDLFTGFDLAKERAAMWPQ